MTIALDGGAPCFKIGERASAGANETDRQQWGSTPLAGVQKR